MNLRSSNVASISSLAVLLIACSGTTLDVGSTSSQASDIKYTGGCTPAQCANQGAGCVGPGPQVLTCAPNPNAFGSLPAGSCQLTATCAGPDAGD